MVFIFVTFQASIMGQANKKFKEIKMIWTSEVIEVSADSLWRIVRDFQNISTWSSNVDHATGSGPAEFAGATCSERVCEVSGLGAYNRVVEKLTLFDEEQQELAYQLTEGAPGFVLYASNHWQVMDAGPGQSRVRMEVTMRLKPLAGFFLGGQMKKTVDKALAVAMEELKVYAERGELSPAKLERMLVLEKKLAKKAA